MILVIFELKDLICTEPRPRGKSEFSELEAKPGSTELVKHYRIIIYYLFSPYRLSSFIVLECLNIHTVIFVILYDNLEVKEAY